MERTFRAEPEAGQLLCIWPKVMRAQGAREKGARYALHFPGVLEKATRRLLGAAARAVDVAVRRTTIARSGRDSGTRALRHEVRLALLRRLSERYERLGAFDAFFRAPRAITPMEDVRKSFPEGGRVVDLHWPADYQTFLPEIQERYDRVIQNHTATARLIAHASPRPAVVLVHGYLGGIHSVERRIWPIPLFRTLGLDVVLFVLPFHGKRSNGRFHELPPFPGADARVTNEGFRQTVGDLRDLVRWLRERGHPEVGVMGMSLGGFTAALAATLEPALSFAVPIIPLASVADAARLNGHLGRLPGEEAEQHRALAEVYRVTSPLERPPLLAPSRMLIVAGENDRITPMDQAQKLAAHFHCRLAKTPGGHLLQVGRGDTFRLIGRFLDELGVLPNIAPYHQEA
jgi:pimeloyl-ACP methyl ester carboxylesterase